eukprot:Rhum_TRINITY_DN14767_c1_g1::Rhum_TRINITY_DN14767_c1_g1_i1::g.116741::m.116741
MVAQRRVLPRRRVQLRLQQRRQTPAAPPPELALPQRVLQQLRPAARRLALDEGAVQQLVLLLVHEGSLELRRQQRRRHPRHADVRRHPLQLRTRRCLLPLQLQARHSLGLLHGGGRAAAAAAEAPVAGLLLACEEPLDLAHARRHAAHARLLPERLQLPHAAAAQAERRVRLERRRGAAPRLLEAPLHARARRQRLVVARLQRLAQAARRVREQRDVAAAQQRLLAAPLQGGHAAPRRHPAAPLPPQPEVARRKLQPHEEERLRRLPRSAVHDDGARGTRSKAAGPGARHRHSPGGGASLAAVAVQQPVPARERAQAVRARQKLGRRAAPGRQLPLELGQLLRLLLHDAVQVRHRLRQQLLLLHEERDLLLPLPPRVPRERGPVRHQPQRRVLPLEHLRQPALVALQLRPQDLDAGALPRRHQGAARVRFLRRGALARQQRLRLRQPLLRRLLRARHRFAEHRLPLQLLRQQLDLPRPLLERAQRLRALGRRLLGCLLQPRRVRLQLGDAPPQRVVLGAQLRHARQLLLQLRHQQPQPRQLLLDGPQLACERVALRRALVALRRRVVEAQAQVEGLLLLQLQGLHERRHARLEVVDQPLLLVRRPLRKLLLVRGPRPRAQQLLRRRELLARPRKLLAQHRQRVLAPLQARQRAGQLRAQLRQLHAGVDRLRARRLQLRREHAGLLRARRLLRLRRRRRRPVAQALAQHLLL